MSELAPLAQHLPDTIEDVAHFLLVAPEKAKAVKAEIQAIKNLGLAKEVYDQKLEEQHRLAELILDASVKIGEFAKTLPRATNGGANQHQAKSTLVSQEQKTKSEAVRELGFSPKQVERFETLADNADIVEQVKAEARESGEIPTRTKVLDLAHERNRREESKLKRDLAQIDYDYDNIGAFRNALMSHHIYSILDNADTWLPSVAGEDEDFPGTIEDIDRVIHALNTIKSKLILLKGGQANES